MSIRSDLLLKATRDLTKLVKVQRVVTRMGRSFVQDFWVSPSQVRSTDKVIGGQQNLTAYQAAPKAKSDYYKSTPATKAIMDGLSKTLGNAALISALKKAGIQFQEHPTQKGITIMHAKMALGKAIEQDGFDVKTLDPNYKAPAQQPQVIQTPPAPAAKTTVDPVAELKKLGVLTDTQLQQFQLLPSAKDKKDFLRKQLSQDDLYKYALSIGAVWDRSKENTVQGRMRFSMALVQALGGSYSTPKGRVGAPDGNQNAKKDGTEVVDNATDKPKADVGPEVDPTLLVMPDDAPERVKNIVNLLNGVKDPEVLRLAINSGMIPEDDYAKEYIEKTLLPEYERKKKDWDGANDKEQRTAFKSYGRSLLHQMTNLGLELNPIDKIKLDFDKFNHAYSVLLDLEHPHNQYVARDNSAKGIRRLLEMQEAYSTYAKVGDPDKGTVGFNNYGYDGDDLDQYKKQFDEKKDGVCKYLDMLSNTQKNDLGVQAATLKQKYLALMKECGYNPIELKLRLQILENNVDDYGSIKDIKDLFSMYDILDCCDSSTVNGFDSALNLQFRGTPTVINPQVAKEILNVAPKARPALKATIKYIIKKNNLQISLDDVDFDASLRYHDGLGSILAPKIVLRSGEKIDIEDLAKNSPHQDFWSYMEEHKDEIPEVQDVFNWMDDPNNVICHNDSGALVNHYHILTHIVKYLCRDPKEGALSSDITIASQAKNTEKLLNMLKVIAHNDPCNKVKQEKFKNMVLDAMSCEQKDGKLIPIPQNGLQDLWANIELANITRGFQSSSITTGTGASAVQGYNPIYTDTDRHYAPTPRVSDTTKIETRSLAFLPTVYVPVVNNDASYTINKIADNALQHLPVISPEDRQKLADKHLLSLRPVKAFSDIKARTIDPTLEKVYKGIISSTLYNCQDAQFGADGDRKVEKALKVLGFGKTPATPKAGKAQALQSSSDLAFLRETAFARVHCTLATEDEETSEKMRIDMINRFDYDGKSHRKIYDGSIDYNRRLLFNSRFFKTNNTKQEDDCKAYAKELGQTTSEYYHGTGYGSTCGILGIDGQFRISLSGSKAGAMLGKGIYLGNMGGKSHVYVGDKSYSSLSYGLDAKSNDANGVIILVSGIRGKPGQSKTAGEDGSDGIKAFEICMRTNQQVYPHHFVDVSARAVGKNVFRTKDGGYNDGVRKWDKDGRLIKNA